MGSVEDRFLAKVQMEPNSGCWLWTGTIGTGGYGGFFLDGRRQASHRVSYELFCEEIPSGLELDHLCRVRCCVNPDHLEPVTHRENARRGLNGAHRAQIELSKTHCPKGHEYTPENTRMHKTSRLCRECARQRHKVWRQNNQEYLRAYLKNWHARKREASIGVI